MIIFLSLVLGLFLWWVFGCCVLAWIDTDGRLLAWVKEHPSGVCTGAVTVALGWPVIVWFWWKDKRAS